MGIEDFLEKDTSYKPQLNHIFNGTLLSTSAKEKRKAYEKGVKIGYDLAWREFRNNLTHPNSVGLSDQEYIEITTIINRLGYIFDYILPTPMLSNGIFTTKYTGLVVRKNMDAYEKGYVVPDNIKKKIFELIINGEGN